MKNLTHSVGGKALASVALVVAFIVGGPSAAFATTTDPLAGGGDSLFTTLQSYLTGNLVPAVIGLAVVGMAIGLLIKWAKKAKAAA